jgi:hypothetical protein
VSTLDSPFILSFTLPGKPFFLSRAILGALSMSFLERNFFFCMLRIKQRRESKRDEDREDGKRSLNRAWTFGAITIFVSVRLLIFPHTALWAAREFPNLFLLQTFENN